jgi:hypothetical protein
MRANKNRYPLLFFLIFAAAVAWPAAAAALVAPTTEGGKVGYLPLNPPAAIAGTQALKATVPTGSPPLIYHGGPVMSSQEAFAIFWAPSSYSFPSGYEEAIETYLEDAAADSGKPSNVYSVSAQYSEESGQHALYSDSYGGSLVDADGYGTTCPEYEGFFGAEFTACVTDEKIQEELTSVVEAEGLPHGLGVEYYMVLPPHVGSCFEGFGGPECFDEVFCAYHSYVEAPELVYSNISYSPEDPLGCGVGEYPNGKSNGNADDTFSSLSHEANESITDPTLEAWFDKKGFENGDECRNTKFGEDYGPALGGSEEEETLFNQVIGANHYYLQQEWSNDIDDCAQRVGPAHPVISGPPSAAPGQTVAFNGSSSTPGDGGIEAFEWEFGDGSGEEGPEVTHSYSEAGIYTVTLTVYDDGSFGFSKTRQITVKTPEEPPPGEEEPPPGGGGGTGGTGTGSGSSGSSPGSSGGPAPVPVAGVAVVGAKAKVKGLVAALKLKCSGGGPCSGVIKLLDHGVIGHAAFHLAAGASKVLKVRLTAGGLALFAKKADGLKVSLSGTGVRHRTLTLTS